MARNFTCLYCNRPTTITEPNEFAHWQRIVLEDSVKGKVGFTVRAITCPNPECNQLFLEALLTDAENTVQTQWTWKPTKILQTWRLLPESEAKVLPTYIPTPIIEDYKEACRIRDLSPKASATLSRRCLQGMIRDFWAISKGTLKEEIDSIKDKVDVDTWESIEAVRKVGKIGAHMEKDINLIVDVEPEESQLLIGLIEQLVDDWYVVRENRKNRTEALKNLVKVKEDKRTSNKAARTKR